MKMKAATLVGLMVMALSPTTHAATVRMDCGQASGGNKEFCSYIKQRFETETPHKLEFVELPPSSDEKLGLYQQIFAAKDGSVVDVLQVDVVWVGLLDKHLLDLTDKVKDLQPAFFPAVWNNNTINGKVKAVPNLVDAGMLFYRKDLLEKYNEKPPATWEELTRIATRIQAAERAAGQKNFWGFVFQGKSYEGLTCDALEWVASYKGGTIVDEKGNITINNPNAVKALNMAAGWAGTISPKGVMGYMEEESRAVFQNGDALFMRNWPYAYLLGQDEKSPIKGKIGVIPVPMGGTDGQHSATLGGWQWAVSAYSKNPDAAIALVRIVSDEQAQKKNYLILGVSPARPALYSDPEIIAKGAHLAEFKDVFASATARPSTATKAQFPEVSKAFFNMAYSVLSGGAKAEAAVLTLETKLKKIKGAAWK